MYKVKILLLPLACLVMFLPAQGRLSAAGDSLAPKKIVLASVECGRKLVFPTTKVEAGFALALQLSKQYSLVSAKEADSVEKHLSASAPRTKEISSLELAKHLQAGAIAFVRIDRLENILRAEIQVVHAPDFERKTKGVGYALIRYRKEKKDTPLLDPAVLTALQRAFAAAVGDSALYAGQPGVYDVQPAPTVVVGGMEFIANSLLPPWGLFEKTAIQGFDAVVTIFDAIKDSRRFVPYDVDSRDSIFALFHLYMIENDRPASRQELDALYKLDVSSYITGTCERTEKGAHVTLHLCDVNTNGTYSIRKTEEGDITKDNIFEFRKTLQTLALKLVQ